ncbi:MAG: glycosyltransferase [Deltaproteobacteria bacterium]|nr:glycosyltransferase [Deltaproteobacteria bacterium]MDH3382539.1 glycosyltransferase [Deltaproteobacteria bacterium]
MSLVETLRAGLENSAFYANVLAGESGPMIERYRELGLRVYIAPIPEWRKLFHRPRFPIAIPRLSTIVSDFAPEVIVSNEIWWSPHALLMSKRLGCRSACIIRDGIATISKARKYRLQELDRIVCVSNSLASQLLPDDVMAPRVRTVYNCVRLPDPDPSVERNVASALERHPKTRKWMLVIGKVGFRKNQAAAVHCLDELGKHGWTEWGLMLAGAVEEDYRPKISRAIQETGLADRVCLLGEIPNIASVLRRADMVILTSTREGMPRSLIEGILGGKLCFTSPVEGSEEIFGEHRSLFVSDTVDGRAIARKILATLKAPDVAEQARAALQERSERLFSPKAHVRALLQALQ